MSEVVVVAIIGFLGTAVGSIAGILTSSKLTAYRLERLEKKVEKHNNLVERMYEAEESIRVAEERIKVANHRIDDLEK